MPTNLETEYRRITRMCLDQYQPKADQFVNAGVSVDDLILPHLLRYPEWNDLFQEAWEVAKLQHEKKFSPELEWRVQILRNSPGGSLLLSQTIKAFWETDQRDGISDWGPYD